MPASRIEKLRILVQQRGTTYRLARIVLSNTNADFYILPYSRGGKYYFGGSTYPEEVVEHTFNFTEQESSELPPHLSFHATGQVHVKGAGGTLAGPLTIPPLDTGLRGHLATVRADCVEALPPLDGQPRRAGRDRDMVVLLGDDVPSCKAVVSLARMGDTVSPNATLILREPPYADMPAVLLLEVREDLALPGKSDSKLGSTLIGGWDPTDQGSGPLDFLFIRTQ